MRTRAEGARWVFLKTGWRQAVLMGRLASGRHRALYHSTSPPLSVNLFAWPFHRNTLWHRAQALWRNGYRRNSFNLQEWFSNFHARGAKEGHSKLSGHFVSMRNSLCNTCYHSVNRVSHWGFSMPSLLAGLWLQYFVQSWYTGNDLLAWLVDLVSFDISSSSMTHR